MERRRRLSSITVGPTIGPIGAGAGAGGDRLYIGLSDNSVTIRLPPSLSFAFVWRPHIGPGIGPLCLPLFAVPLHHALVLLVECFGLQFFIPFQNF